MSKPEGPTPPSGYRWVPKGQIVWPDDVMECHTLGMSSKIPAAVSHSDLKPAEKDFQWMRPIVPQPDLVWLRSQAVKHVEAGSDHVMKEIGRWKIRNATQAYSEALRALVPEREQYRPDRKGGEA